MNKPILVWIDLEMTGLNPQVDTILEIATIITDGNLNVLEEGPTFVIHQDAATLNIMKPVVKELHDTSGLTKAVQTSNTTMREAEKATLELIKKYAERREAYLAGNSVWQDKAFLQKYMKSITEYLHYRIVDVTSFKIAINAWYPKSAGFDYRKEDKHRALDDIKESIQELKFYKKNFFVE